MKSPIIITMLLVLLSTITIAGCLQPDTIPSHQPGYNATECARLDREMANGTPGHNHTMHEIACGLPPDSMKDNMSVNMTTNSTSNMTMTDDANATNKTNSTNMSSMG